MIPFFLLNESNMISPSKNDYLEQNNSDLVFKGSIGHVTS